MNKTILKFQYPKSCIKEYEFWVVMIRPKQVTLGSLIIAYKDDVENLCIQIIEGPFHHVVVKYKNFKLKPKLNEDGSLNCDYEYDIITAPSSIGENGLTDEEGDIFERKLGESLLEILWETANNENRNSNTKESITE